MRISSLLFCALILWLKPLEGAPYFEDPAHRTQAFLKVTNLEGDYYFSESFYDSLLASKPARIDVFFCHVALAWYHRNNNPEATTNEIIQAKSLLNQSPGLEQWQGYLFLAEAKAYRHFNQFEKSMSFLQKAEAEFSNADEASMLLITRTQMVLTLNDLDKQKEAVVLQRKLFVDLEEYTGDSIEKKQLELYLYSNYSTLLTMVSLKIPDSLERAKALLLETIQKAKDLEHGYIFSNAKGNLAYVYMLGEHYQEALGLAREDLNYSIKSGRIVSVAHLNYLMAEIFFGLNQLDSAGYYIKNAELLIDHFSKTRLLTDYGKLSIKYYQRIGDPNAAFSSMERQLQILSQLYLKKSETDFELLKAEQDLLSAEQNLEKLQVKNIVKDRMAILLIGLLVILSLMLIYIFKQNALHKKQNKELELLNNTLEDKVERRTKKIVEQNLKIKEIAFRNSHKTRAPVARLLGLIELLNISPAEEQEEIAEKIRESVKEIDEVIFEMNNLLSEE